MLLYSYSCLQHYENSASQMGSYLFVTVFNDNLRSQLERHAVHHLHAIDEEEGEMYAGARRRLKCLLEMISCQCGSWKQILTGTVLKCCFPRQKTKDGRRMKSDDKCMNKQIKKTNDELSLVSLPDARRLGCNNSQHISGCTLHVYCYKKRMGI